ncbi:MAG: YabP/YqfC family sporulation protein [Eubacteriales bacterium]|nr:YabP/YqfC family sporulation protein [Eubacteriales bacterium]
MKLFKSKKADKESDAFEYYFGKPRLEMTGRECLVDGLERIIEYSSTKITVSLGSQLITFIGNDLKINSYTREGAIVEGNIMAMEFSND